MFALGIRMLRVAKADGIWNKFQIKMILQKLTVDIYWMLDKIQSCYLMRGPPNHKTQFNASSLPSVHNRPWLTKITIMDKDLRHQTNTPARTEFTANATLGELTSNKQKARTRKWYSYCKSEIPVFQIIFIYFCKMIFWKIFLSPCSIFISHPQ